MKWDYQSILLTSAVMLYVGYHFYKVLEEPLKIILGRFTGKKFKRKKDIKKKLRDKFDEGIKKDRDEK